MITLRESTQTIDAWQPGDLDQLAADFGRFLLRQDRSPATVQTYQWALANFRAFTGGRGLTELAELGNPRSGRALLENWQDSLFRLKPESRRLATNAVRQFLRWAADHDYVDARASLWLSKVRMHPGKPKPLEQAQLATLRAYFAIRPVPTRKIRGKVVTVRRYLQRLRNRALFFYLLGTGCRVSEALQVPRQGFERCIVRQKGGSQKLLVCPMTVLPALHDYVRARTDRYPLLFASHRQQGTGGPITPAQVRGVWLLVTRQLGLEPFTTHRLRHSFATELLDAGIDAVTVAELLGHHGMSTIRNYGELREGRRQAALSVMDSLIQAPVDKKLQPKRRYRRRVAQ